MPLRPPSPASPWTIGRLYGAVDALVREFCARHQLSCQHCNRCCSQLVPVWPAEVAALLPGVRACAGNGPEAAALRERARRQLDREDATLRRGGARRVEGTPALWEITTEQLAALAGTGVGSCVLLGPEGCRAYDRRPLLCRLYGVPLVGVPGNLCRRMSAAVVRRPGSTPAVGAATLERIGQHMRALQPGNEPIPRVTTVAAIVVAALEASQ